MASASSYSAASTRCSASIPRSLAATSCNSTLRSTGRCHTARDGVCSIARGRRGASTDLAPPPMDRRPVAAPWAIAAPLSRSPSSSSRPHILLHSGLLRIEASLPSLDERGEEGDCAANSATFGLGASDALPPPPHGSASPTPARQSPPRQPRARNKVNPSGIPFVSLAGQGTVCLTHYPPRIRKIKANIAVTLPHPEPAVATSSRAKRKLIRDSQRSQAETATFANNLDLSSVPDDLSDDETYVRPDQITPGRAAPSLTVLPSPKEAIDLRARTVQPDSQTRKRLFGDDEKKAAELGDKVATKAEDM